MMGIIYLISWSSKKREIWFFADKNWKIWFDFEDEK